jgi:flagella basal body P-ring formation protein FlgA
MKPISTHSLSVIYALLLAGFMIALAFPAMAETGQSKDPDVVAVPVTLNPVVQVDADFIHLGDLFEPAGKYADRTVLRAPNPGQEMVLPAVWLWKAAKTFGIDWQPTSTADTVTVSRPSSVITADQIEDLLKDSFFKRTGEDDLVEVEEDGGPYKIHLPRSSAPTARVERFDYDAHSGRFTATLLAPAEGRPLEKMNISGRFHRLVELPVPTRRLGKGHIIESSDLTLVRLREENLGTNLIIDESKLVGQSVGRSLTSGKPVRLGDVGAPILVEKNRIITVSLRTDRMVLSVQGRAMENGALNDVIRVQNTQSNTVIDAVVTGSGRVEVQVQQPLAMRAE